MDQDTDEYSSQFSQDDHQSISPESDAIQEESPTPNVGSTFIPSDQLQANMTPEPELSLQLRPSSAKRLESEVVFNISNTKYKVVKEVGGQLFQWNLCNDFKSTWDVAWIDVTIDNTAFSRLKPFQTINFFPGIHCIARKDQLSNNLKRLKRRFPESYDFFPETFTLPAEYNELKAYFMKEARNKKVVIVKPQASCQGKGIYLTDNIRNIPENGRCVVQKYLTKPYLLDGLKFDLRIYVLLASCSPSLKIYLFDDGLARFATETYKNPDMSNMTDMYMHLTNYAINKDSPNFVFNTSVNDHNVGHKRSIKALFKDLRKRGHDIETLWGEIKKMIIKTFCSVQPVLNQNYKSHLFTKNRSDACFQVFGFDVIIDENFKPWLLEVNASPSFSTDTPLDKSIKENVIRDALKIMNISAENRLNYKKKSPSHRNDAEPEPASSNHVPAEDISLGGYEKIYPLEGHQDEDYDVYLNEANKFWSLALGISAKKDRLLRKPLDSKNVTSQGFMRRYENEKIDLGLSSLLAPELQSSTERNEIRCRGGKRGVEEIQTQNQTPTKFFDIRTPLYSPSNPPNLTNQTFTSSIRGRNNNDISMMEICNERSYIFPNIQTLLNERESSADNSTPVIQVIEYPHSYHQTPRNRETDVVKFFKPVIGRESSRLLNKSPDKIWKESLDHKRSVNNIMKKRLEIKPHTNPIASLSASESFYKASMEKTMEIKRRRFKPRQNDAFTIVGVSQPQQKPGAIMVNEEDPERYSLPKRFAQHLVKQKMERDQSEEIQNQTIVNLLPFERAKLRSAQNNRPKSSMRRPEQPPTPVYNLITLKEVKYQKTTPKLANFIMPKLNESLSNTFLKKMGFTSPKSKENYTGSKIRVIGTKVTQLNS